jgi:small subunit ribosomal protein S6
MKGYEGMFLVKPDLSKEDLAKTSAHIQEIIVKYKGSSDEMTELGKQRLAYPIKKYKEGVYYIVNFHAEPDAIVSIKRALSLSESILRLLITKR